MHRLQKKAFTVCLISLGCAKNKVDTETILAGLPKNTIIVPTARGADVVVVNTCAFIQDAQKESIDAILDVAALRSKGKVRRLLVTGCLSQRFRQELAEELPEVDRFFGTSDVKAVIDDIRAFAEHQDLSHAERLAISDPDRKGFDWNLDRQNTSPRGQAWLKIAEGCSNRCGFCVIPSVRGPLRSRPLESIVQEAQTLVENGVKELNVIAQDITLYGCDFASQGLPRRNIVDLLDQLETLDVKWIRLLYAYPRNFPQGLLEKMAQSQKILPYLDIPLQHISSPVLKAMGRPVDGPTTRARIEELRQKVPGIVLRTTMMVGHPGETEDAFKELCDYVQEARFERLGVFAYSQEEGTPSGDREDQIPDDIKQERRNKLLEIQRSISRDWLASQVGQSVEVLIEGPSDESPLVYEGRTKTQAPEVDGVTYIGLHDSIKPGALVKATITDSTDYDLAAELDEA